MHLYGYDTGEKKIAGFENLRSLGYGYGCVVDTVLRVIMVNKAL